MRKGQDEYDDDNDEIHVLIRNCKSTPFCFARYRRKRRCMYTESGRTSTRSFFSVRSDIIILYDMYACSCIGADLSTETLILKQVVEHVRHMFRLGFRVRKRTIRALTLHSNLWNAFNSSWKKPTASCVCVLFPASRAAAGSRSDCVSVEYTTSLQACKSTACWT